MRHHCALKYPPRLMVAIPTVGEVAALTVPNLEEIAAEFELKALPNPTNQANYGYRSIDWLGCTVPCFEAASSLASPARTARPHRSSEV